MTARVGVDQGRGPDCTRYRLTIDVVAGSLHELEHKIIDIAGQVHNLAYSGRPVPEIDSHVRSLGATLKAVPRG